MLALLALLACAPKVQVAPTSAAAAPRAGAPVENPLLLWRVERDRKVSYLLGTCHLGVHLDYALPAPHAGALDRAKVVFTEAELDLDDPGRAVRLLWAHGPGLSTRLSAGAWRRVAAAVRSQFPVSVLEHMEPWAVSAALPFLTVRTEARDLGGPPGGTSMDLAVQARARARDIPVEHVETLEEQAAMLGKWNDTFLAQLERGELDAAGGEAESDALSALCYRGDTRNSAILTQPGDPFSDRILRDRNRAWLPRLLPALAAGDAFVAVGAGHMLGEGGLLDLLAAEGYSVTQLTSRRPVSNEALPSDQRGPPAAPPLPPDAEARVTAAVPRLVGRLCDEGSLLRTCFTADAAACEGRVAVDATLCARAWVDRIQPDGIAEDRAAERSLEACVPAGVIFEAFAAGTVSDAPACRLLAGAMQSGGD